jgi:ATP synthase protein I
MPTKSLKNIVQNQAYAIVFWQLACVILLAFTGFLLHGTNTGLSLLAGGMAYGLANLIFVWRVFRYVGAQQMTQFAAAFMLGEMGKLILSGILFILIVKYLPVSLLSVLVGFVGAIVSFWLVCMWQFSKQPKTNKE